MKKYRGANSEGFTLIELLIVIVIIGILAGVLVAVINPSTQQNVARDAGVKASINKVALGVEGYIAAYGSAPQETQVLGVLQNVTENGATCSTSGAYDCLFSVQGNTLPETCGATGWSGSGAAQCYFRYVSAAASTTFQIFAKSHGIENAVFVFDSSVSVLQHCDVNGANCVTPGE